jgi:hypothetical protein
MPDAYDASSIHILAPEQAQEQFFWAKAGALAAEYCRPSEWIERGLLACERVGVPHDYFIDRYLKKQPLPKHDGVDAAMRDLWIEQRNERSVTPRNAA